MSLPPGRQPRGWLVAIVFSVGACALVSATPPPSWPAAEVPNYHRIDETLATADAVSPAAIPKIAAAGFRTVIDLRTRGEAGVVEEAAAAERAGLRYVNIPVTPATLTAEHVRQVAAVLDQPANQPVLLHCSSGNRVGGVMELYREQLHGVEHAAAHAEATDLGLKLPEMIEAVDRVRREMQTGR